MTYSLICYFYANMRANGEPTATPWIYHIYEKGNKNKRRIGTWTKTFSDDKSLT